MIIKAAGRFLTALFVSIALGLSLYLAMHFVAQPLADKFNPETPSIEENNPVQSGDNIANRPERQAPSFDIGDFIHGLFSVAKNGAVVVFVTVIVVAFRSFLGKKSPRLIKR